MTARVLIAPSVLSADFTRLAEATAMMERAGADMLRPLAIAVIGALCISVLLSLVATPVAYSLMAPRDVARASEPPAGSAEGQA